ncbi:hypothetical protein H6P81_006655 [Aristolochia fimbriata]|uniref:Vacuolar ATPase assembly integral membrane protein VMA21 homolog n=1 Tax=Aristolochia fimbriata TaxID=158543 RepID=A0AAV7F1M4_ARIFI|nr:hypothetical protein H6P81_006655 [Aristolochia fimbriata]
MDQKQSTSSEPSSEPSSQTPQKSTPVPATSSSRSCKSRFFNFRPYILIEKLIPDEQKRSVIGLLLATLIVLLLPAWVYGYVAYYVSETGANPFLAFVVAFLGHAGLTVLLIFVISKCIDSMNKDEGQPPHKKDN